MKNFDKESHGMSRLEYAEDRLESSRHKCGQMHKAIVHLAAVIDELRAEVEALEKLNK